MKKLKRKLLRRREAIPGRPSSVAPPSSLYPPPRIDYSVHPGMTGWELLAPVMSECHQLRVGKRHPQAERRFVARRYEEVFGQPPPEGMEWELVRARLYTALQHHGFKLAGRELELTSGFLCNLRAAWGKEAEANRLMGWDARVGGTFLFQHQTEEKEMAISPVVKTAKKLSRPETTPTTPAIAPPPSTAAQKPSQKKPATPKKPATQAKKPAAQAKKVQATPGMPRPGTATAQLIDHVMKVGKLAAAKGKKLDLKALRAWMVEVGIAKKLVLQHTLQSYPDACKLCDTSSWGKRAK